MKRLFLVAIIATTSIYWEAYGYRSEITFQETRLEGSLNQSFLKNLKDYFNPHYFFETGTFGGITTIRAAQVFSEVYTVELSQEYFIRNINRFQSITNIHAYLGESSKILSDTLSSINGSQGMFFLDAHYSSPGTARGDKNTPLLDEIRVIGIRSPHSIILIDDLRCCQKPELIKKQLNLDPQATAYEGYPSLLELKNECLKINKSYEFVIYGDIGMIYPKNAYPFVTLSPVVKGMTISRMFEELESPSIEEEKLVMQAEHSIMCAQGKEKEGIKLLLAPSEGRGIPAIYTTHYKLWNALIYINEGNGKKALSLLEELKIDGFTHHRRNAYVALAQDKLS